MESSNDQDDDLFTKKRLAKRYVKHPKTVERWVESGVLPPPDLVIQNQWYWRRYTIEKNERERMGARKPSAA
jgi:hypothetical protein